MNAVLAQRPRRRRFFQESFTFPSAQNPIASGWQNNSDYYTKARVGGAGNCYGLQPNPFVTDQYQDAYAYRLGYDPFEQYVEIVAKVGTTAGQQEIECLLNWVDTNNTTSGYECGISNNGQYAFINRAKGVTLSGPADISNYDECVQVLGVVSVTNGMLIKAWRKNYTIHFCYGGTSLTLDGTDIVSPFDCTSGGRIPMSGGGPGIGFFSGTGAAANDQFGISACKTMNVQ